MRSLGAHVPQRVLTNTELESIVQTSDDWIHSRTGIRERRIADRDEATSDLAVPAAREALERADVAPEDVDVVIVGTSTPDHLYPATATLVAHRLGAANAAAFDLLAACSSFVYALGQGVAFVESGMARTVLAVGADVNSRLLDWNDRATCVLFGDGAGAAVLTAAEPDGAAGFLGFELGADGSGGDLLIIPGGGGRYPVGGTDPRGKDVFIRMHGREVYRFAVRIMVESVSRLLEAAEVPADEVDLFVAHQANHRIIETAAERLGLRDEQVFTNVDRYGNTSAASIPIALAEARDTDRLGAGDLVMMVGFGAGLTWGSALGRYEP
jgi:3-oxoacyl-[acyl-carrier-protein] synthase-3